MTAVEIPDELADAIFLEDHPGWSWDELQRAPADVIELMRRVRRARARTTALAAAAAESRLTAAVATARGRRR